MRILIICPRGLSDKGGIGRLVGYFTQAWQLQKDAPTYRILDSRGPYHLMWSPFFFLYALCIIMKLFLFREVDLVHIHLASYGSTVRKACIIFLAIVFRVPAVLHLHGAKYHLFYRSLPWALKFIVRSMFAQATRVIVLGESWLKFVCGEVGVDRDRVVVMLNAVPGPSSLECTRSIEPVHILFLGNIGKRKGVAELLEALGSDRVKSLGWRAVLAGGGKIERYSARATYLCIRDRIEFPGWVDVDTVRHYLRHADILVLPSYQEGLPMAVLEGMAYGLAVITTPVGAITDVVEDGISGFLVPPGDSSSLADALVQVIANESLRVSLSEGARKCFVEKLDIRHYAARLTHLYGECIKAG